MADRESLLAGERDFNPSSWVIDRSIGIQAKLLVQFGEYSKLRIISSLTFTVAVSESHPVWKYIKKDPGIGCQLNFVLHNSMSVIGCQPGLEFETLAYR